MASDFDVAVVGCGPVGQVLAILLAQRGQRCVVLDKWPQPYGLPRAVHFDDEVARVLALAGLGAELPTFTEPAYDYEWRNAAGETLLKFDWSHAGDLAWPFANMFSQPDLESALARRIAGLSGIDVRRGEEAIQLAQDTDGVTLQTLTTQGERRTLRARYLVGCDGAQSFVRQHLSTALTDLGFFYDWLILDVVLNEAREFKPLNLQICDPERPVTVVSGGPGRRRFEFMRLPHETAEELHSVERAWEFLQAWDITPLNARLERHAVYTFAARWADVWRDGRLLLAGDAAHLMPPFAGQGMCSGLRDAANLAWKLDLVVSGKAPEVLLDTYGAERCAHVQNAIGMSVALGNVICVTDREAVAARDAGMIAAGAAPERILPPLPPPTLTQGIVQKLADGSVAPGAGGLWMQAKVARDGRTDRFDTVIGTGFVVIATEDPHGILGTERLAFLASIDAHVVHVLASGTLAAAVHADAVIDAESRYGARFAQSGIAAVVVRPDFYTFGTAATLADLPALIDDLRDQLARPFAIAARPTQTADVEPEAIRA